MTQSTPSNDSSESTRLKSNEDDVSLDVMFEILKNGRRRMVLEYLKDNDRQVKLSDLADEVTARENDTDVASITSTERKRVYVGLYQFHLPKMDDMNIIEFDQDRGTVSLAEKGRKLLRAHERNSSAGKKWHFLYFGLATLGLFAAGATLMIGSSSLALLFLTVQSLLFAAVAVVQTLKFHNGIPNVFHLPHLKIHSKLPYRGG